MTEEERKRKYGNAVFATQQAAHVENAQRAEILKKKEEEEKAAKLKAAAAAAAAAAQEESKQRAEIVENKARLKAESMSKIIQQKEQEKERAAKLSHAAAAATEAAHVENATHEYNVALNQIAEAQQKTAEMQKQLEQGVKSSNFGSIVLWGVIGIIAWKILKKKRG